MTDALPPEQRHKEMQNVSEDTNLELTLRHVTKNRACSGIN